MDQTRQLSWQLTVIMCSMIVVFGGGTFALLLTGRTVPGELWPILGGIGTAVLGVGGFFNMRQMHAASLWHLAQSNAAGQGALVDVATQATTTTNQTHTETGTAGDSPAEVTRVK